MFEIVPMKKKHIDEVHKIELENFGIPWSKKSFEKEIVSNEYAHYFVAVDTIENIVVGYGGLWIVVNEAHITNIAVKDTYKRKGIATLIIDEMCRFSKSRQLIGLTLEVRVNNASARGLYGKLGFEIEGIRKEYYYDTKEDALIMWKYLIPKELII